MHDTVRASRSSRGNGSDQLDTESRTSNCPDQRSDSSNTSNQALGLLDRFGKCKNALVN